LNRAIETVLRDPLPNAPRPLKFSVIRVPFFLEPQYDEKKEFVESNRERLVKKWGGKEGWERQKRTHNLKGRGLEYVGSVAINERTLKTKQKLWLEFGCFHISRNNTLTSLQSFFGVVMQLQSI